MATPSPKAIPAGLVIYRAGPELRRARLLHFPSPTTAACPPSAPVSATIHPADEDAAGRPADPAHCADRQGRRWLDDRQLPLDPGRGPHLQGGPRRLRSQHLAVRFHTSYMPVVAAGTQADAVDGRSHQAILRLGAADGEQLQQQRRGDRGGPDRGDRGRRQAAAADRADPGAGLQGQRAARRHDQRTEAGLAGLPGDDRRRRRHLRHVGRPAVHGRLRQQDRHDLQGLLDAEHVRIVRGGPARQRLRPHRRRRLRRDREPAHGQVHREGQRPRRRQVDPDDHHRRHARHRRLGEAQRAAVLHRVRAARAARPRRLREGATSTRSATGSGSITAASPTCACPGRPK